MGKKPRLSNVRWRVVFDPGADTVVAEGSIDPDDVRVRLEIPTDAVTTLIATLQRVVELNPNAFPPTTPGPGRERRIYRH